MTDPRGAIDDGAPTERKTPDALPLLSPRVSAGRASVPPCCADAVCPQHLQQAGVVRRQGPRNRSGRGHLVVGEPGRARPAREPEDQP
jgi:hypothetical protein